MLNFVILFRKHVLSFFWSRCTCTCTMLHFFVIFSVINVGYVIVVGGRAVLTAVTVQQVVSIRHDCLLATLVHLPYTRCDNFYVFDIWPFKWISSQYVAFDWGTFLADPEIVRPFVHSYGPFSAWVLWALVTLIFICWPQNSTIRNAWHMESIQRIRVSISTQGTKINSLRWQAIPNVYDSFAKIWASSNSFSAHSVANNVFFVFLLWWEPWATP